MSARALKALAVKEFKDLVRDPRILIPFIVSALVLPVVGLVMSATMRQAAQQALKANAVAIVDLDRTRTSRQLVTWLKGLGFRVIELDPASEEELARKAAENGVAAVLILEQGFEEKLMARKRVKVTVVAVVRDLSPFSQVGSMAAIRAVERYAVEKMLEGLELEPEVLENPLTAKQAVYIASKELLLPGSAGRLAGLIMASILVPMIVMSSALVVMQMGATSMAIENEEKTLETLLTLPVPRAVILASKLLGAFAVSLIGTVLNLAGVAVYFILLSSAFVAPLGGEAAVGGFTLLVAPSDLACLSASLLLSLFFAAALGLIIGALSQDTRIANTLVGPLSMAFYLPAIFLTLAPSELLTPPVRALLYVLPVTQPAVAARDAVAGRLPPEAPLYLAASLLFSLATVYAASKLFSLEVLASVQYRLSRWVRRRRGGGK